MIFNRLITVVFLLISALMLVHPHVSATTDLSNYVQQQINNDPYLNDKAKNGYYVYPTSTPIPTVNPYPTISYTPKATDDPNEVKLLNQIQNHKLSNSQILLLYSILGLPLLPISWKLGLYKFLSVFPLPTLSTKGIVVLMIIGPFATVVGIFLLILIIRRFGPTLFPALFSFLPQKHTKTTCLELIFPHDTSKSAFATEQLYKLIHAVSRKQAGFFKPHKIYSFEIVADGESGIRYLLVVPTIDSDVIRRCLLSYLPGIQVHHVPDFLEKISYFQHPIKNTNEIDANDREEEMEIDNDDREHKTLGVLEFELSKNFVLPLQNQKTLNQHDPMSYLIGNMTKLQKGELIAYQIVMTPTLGGNSKNRISQMQQTIYQGLPLSPLLFKQNKFSYPSLFLFLLSPLLWVIVEGFKLLIHLPMLVFDPNGPGSKNFFSSKQKEKLKEIALNPYELELGASIKEKLNQQLFTTSIRLYIQTQTSEEFEARENGLTGSFSQFSSAYQSLNPKDITGLPILSSMAVKKQFTNFKNRYISDNNLILSSSEISDLYHFPNTDITQIEGLVKSKSRELPAPVSMKKKSNLDVVIGVNTYGGEVTTVGLTAKQRHQHTYIIGKSGMGKSTIIEGMALQDIANGKGVCVIDAHGDMIEHLLSLIPKNRLKDVVYVNPSDKAFPVGINILNPSIEFEDKEERESAIGRSVLNIFMKITPEKNWGQRMEHILRNAILTSLQIPIETVDTPYISLFAIQKLLTDEAYRKVVTEKITDPVLQQFWKKEFSLYRKSQQADIISPLTNKIGEFITDKLTRYIILQKKSTINITDIMDNGKILLVNLSKGKLGEERSAFFGTVIVSLIQLAIHERAQTKVQNRREFYVYIDEFQNFATPQFSEIFSEARKYKVFFIPTHQNIAQIDDTKITKIMHGNAGILITLRGSPDDEKALLAYLEPEVEKGQIVNLPVHHFFMKIQTEDCEDTFTGITLPIDGEGSEKMTEEIIDISRENYTTPREEVEKQLELLFKAKATQTKSKTKKDKKKPKNERKRRTV
ncbi:MAG TPA: DUF87 domain-containing protein [Patescibacteria group bacterium]|nr:DUF87 domain-containing protein [Patescibacteria group bacterium]